MCGSARRKFFILADSDNSLVPQVIESGHMFGVQFQISEKYPETEQILLNYVKHKFNQMNAYEYLDISSAFLLVGVHGNPSGESRPPPPPAAQRYRMMTCISFKTLEYCAKNFRKRLSVFHEFAETTFNG